jgi:hypothetical protein
MRTASDPAIREGEPPRYPEPRGIDLDPPHILRRWLPLVIVVVIGLTVAGLLTPVVLKVRQAAARTQSTNNLKVTGLAFHGFHDANKRLPFNGTVPVKAGDNTSGSWAFQILPFVDQKPLFDRPNANVGVAVYMCPGRGRPVVCETGAWTDYFINPWINHLDGIVNAPDGKRTLVGITDGTSNTIMLGQGNVDPELYSSRFVIEQSVDIFRGGNPATARRSTTNQADKSGDAGLNWGGPFPEGCLFCMGDATVRLFPSATHNGGIIKNGQCDINSGWCGHIPPPPSHNFGLGSFLTPWGGDNHRGCPDT